MKNKFLAMSVALAACTISPMTMAATESVDAPTFEGRVIGLIACNANENVLLSLYNDKTDKRETFVAKGKTESGALNPLLARAYISVGKASKPNITVTYNPNYDGETCGAEVAGEWTGYAPKVESNTGQAK